MKVAKDNGKRLENAVRLIQEMLLENDPQLKGGTFTIEPNKHFTISGTRHEVDVYVVTNPGTTYEAKVLFECKDWQKPVSKNEVIVLKEKVELLGASRGILVARELTKDAEALLSQPTYQRIHFQPFRDEFYGLLGVEVFVVTHEIVDCKVQVTSYPHQPAFPANINYCTFHSPDRVGIFNTFVNGLVDEITIRDQKKWLDSNVPDSIRWFETIEYMRFSRGEFVLNDIELATMAVHVAYFVKLSHKVPCYQCSMAGAGQAITFQIHPEDPPFSQLEINVLAV